MTVRAPFWPTGYDLAVIRRFCPWMLAELAARIIALVAAGLLAVLRPGPVVLVVLALVVVPVLAAELVAVWSAPFGADSMMTGPPCRLWETPYGAGRV